jgi:hypothetical protein
MPVIQFQNDDEYRRWLDENPSGFVVNTTRPPSPDYMVLHAASCGYLREPSHETEPGGFTERGYTKVCAPDIESLRSWVEVNGRQNRSFSNECSRCHPMQ